MKITLAATALFAMTATSASALDATSTFVPLCERAGAQAGESQNVASGACGCLVGVIGGKTTAREFAAFEYIAPSVFDQTQMQSGLQRAIQNGFTEPEIQGLAQALMSMETDGIRVCQYYQTISATQTVNFVKDEAPTSTPMINMDDPSLASEIATFGAQLRQSVQGQ